MRLITTPLSMVYVAVKLCKNKGTQSFMAPRRQFDSENQILSAMYANMDDQLANVDTQTSNMNSFFLGHISL